MEICLINPASIFLIDERVFPALGILKVAASFELQGAKIDVLDLSGISNWEDVIKEYFEVNKDFDFIGLTSSTPQIAESYKIALGIRNIVPNIKLVLGGPHATAMNAAHKSEKKRNIENGRASIEIEKLLKIFDVLVCGDGELTLNGILKIKHGIVDADDRKSELFLTNQQFTDLPFPNRSLIDLESYHYEIEGHKACSIILQLGCPFFCQFCGMRQSPSMRIIRNRTVESAIKEIKELYLTYGYTGYMMFDDELNVSKSMIELMNSLSDLQMELGVSFKFRGFLKSELTTEEQIIAMKNAGFTWLLCGFESANERILKNIQKVATVEDNTRFIELAKKHGLKTKALTSLGHAGDSHETIEDTKNWLIKMEVEDFDATVITVFGGSPYYDFATKITDDVYVYTQKKTGDKLYQKSIDYMTETNYYKGKPGDYTSFVWTDYITAEELVKARDNLESEVRSKLNIPFNLSNPARKFEHSMGSSRGILPSYILRSSDNK